MTKGHDQEPIAIRAIGTFADGLQRDFGVIADINKSAASRLVWFVAIAGFALLNIGGLAGEIVGKEFDGTKLLILVMPWAMAGLSGVIAHWLLGEVTARDNVYYVVKQHGIRAFLATAPPQPTVEDVLEVLNIDETNEEVASRKRQVDRISPWATRAERLTFSLLILSFAWSIIFPLFLVLRQ